VSRTDEIPVPREAKDRVLRWLFEILKNGSLAPLGVNVPKPAAPLPSDVLQVDVRRSATDALFRAEDQSILHIEFQMTSTQDDLRRFLLYDAGVLGRYRDAPKVHTVVLYGPHASPLPPDQNFGSISYTVHAVYLGQQNGEARLNELLHKAKSHGRLEQEDILTLALVPLMQHHRPLWQLLLDAKPLFEYVPRAVRDPLLYAMVALGYAYETAPNRTKLKEVLGLMSIGQEFLEDIMRDALQKGMEKGLETGIARGKLEASREDVLEVIEVRFGTVPSTVRAKVEATTDVETLRQWHRLALQAGSLPEIEERIR